MAYPYDQYNSYDQDSNTREVGERLVSRDGSILGGLVKLPQPLAIAIGSFQPFIVAKIAQFGAEPATKAFTAAAKTLGHKSPDAIGKKLGGGTAILLPYALNILDVVGTTREHFKARKELLARIEPLTSANKAAHKAKGGMLSSVTEVFDSGYEDNKMVQTALKGVKDSTYTKLTADAISVIPSLIVNHATRIDRKIDTATERMNQLQWGGEHADIPQQELAALRTEITGLEKKRSDAHMLSLAGGGIDQAVSTYLDRKNEASTPATSLEKVLQLQQMIRDENLDGTHNVASNNSVESVALKVDEIFQTFQKEQRHRTIPSHRMREVSKIIAEELIGGDLHALSLVNIVGNEKLLNDKKDGIVSSDKIAEVLKQEVAIFSKSSTITSEEFLKDAGYSLDDVKNHLKSKDKDERALTVMVHPDALLMEAGLKKDEIKDYRAHISQKMQEGVFAAIMQGLAKQSDEQLESNGFSREAIEFIHDHEGQPISDAMKSRANIERFKKVTGTALMGKEVGDKSTSWREVIEAGRAGKVAKSGPAANDDAGGHISREAAANDAHALAVAGGVPIRSRSPMDFAERDGAPRER